VSPPVDDVLVARTETPWGPWEPATVPETAALFAAVAAPWWIAGGWAIELAAGRPLREHSDIDVLLLRRDQLAAQDALPGWEWWAADPPGTLRPWRTGQRLPDAIHDIWCRPGPDDPWRVQIMLDESDGPDWVSRRGAHIRRPIPDLGRTTPDGIPYVAPEVQLLYKAKQVRPKDEADFTAILPLLTDRERGWLHAALTTTYGPHPWQTRL
jgi:hypothetical protein